MKGFYKVKDSWDLTNYYSSTAEDLVAAGGFIWPPRCYKCSFCKREFRSAQALGGHMNVHRRDRAARLMKHESPPRDISCNNQSTFLNLNLCPNPSFNQNPSNFFPEFPNFTSKLPQILPSSGSEMAVTTDLVKMKDTKRLLGVEKYNEFVCEKGCEDVGKKRGFVKLDLEIGIVNECKEELDLELRLGCN